MEKIREAKRGLTHARKVLFPLVQTLLGLLVFPDAGFAIESGLNNAYFFAATANNVNGVESVDFSIVGLDEPTPSTLNIIPVSDADSGNGIVSLRVNAPENVGMAMAQFLVNGLLVGESTASPHAFSWDTSALTRGDYTVSVKAFDAAGNEALLENVSVQVAGDITPPIVALAAPGASGTASGTIAVSASANDNVSVTKVEIYVDDVMVATNDQNYVSYNWNTAAELNGAHVLSAKAYDAAGNGQSTYLAVSVFNDTAAPAVSISAPVANSTVGGLVTVLANASDNLAVTKVEFYVNGVLKATSTSAPYSFTWNTGTLANGTYTLSAKAYDAAANLAESTTVLLNVGYDLTAPSVNVFSMPSTINSTTVPVLSFSASDNVAVTGYLITKSATAPLASDSRWSAAAPTSVRFAKAGTHTAYAWAKDAAGNVSAGRAVTVLVDTALPTFTSMTLTSGNSSFTVNTSATDNIGVTKMELYLNNMVQYQTTANSFSYVCPLPSKTTPTVTVKVYDGAGNVRSRSLKVSRY